MRRTLRRRANTLDATHAKSVLQLHTKKEIQDLKVLQDHLNNMVSHFKKFEEHLLAFVTLSDIAGEEHDTFKKKFRDMYGHNYQRNSRVSVVNTPLKKFFILDRPVYPENLPLFFEQYFEKLEKVQSNIDWSLEKLKKEITSVSNVNVDDIPEFQILEPLKYWKRK